MMPCNHGQYCSGLQKTQQSFLFLLIVLSYLAMVANCAIDIPPFLQLCYHWLDYHFCLRSRLYDSYLIPIPLYLSTGHMAGSLITSLLEMTTHDALHVLSLVIINGLCHIQATSIHTHAFVWLLGAFQMTPTHSDVTSRI